MTCQGPVFGMGGEGWGGGSEGFLGYHIVFRGNGGEGLGGGGSVIPNRAQSGAI